MDYRRIAAFITLIVFCTACRTKDKTTVTPTSGKGKVKLEFFNMAGSSTLNLNNQWYLNEHNDSFTVSRFDYYISNVVLNSGAVTYTESDSYHLIKQSDVTTRSFDMNNIPAGTYTSITFMIGIDSLHNITGTQTGALDPINDMFWSWTTGYIMMKFEGKSPKSPNANNAITMHFGGFSGVNSVLKTVTITFPQAVNVNTTAENHIHLSADVLALFRSPNVIDLSITNSIHSPGADAKKVADNYANMFSVTYSGL